MTEIQLREIADILWQAEKTRVPVESLSKGYSDLTLNHAYAVSSFNAQRRVAEEKQRLVGYKIGLTSREAQKHFQLFHPDYGCLFDSMVVPDEGEILLSELIQPKIEGEIAFVLEHDLKGPGVTVADAVRAVGFVMNAMEIIDSRIQNWKITATDTIADNGSSARLVLSGIKQKLDSLDLPSLGMALSKNGEVVLTSAGAAVMGNPLNALVFLANELGRQGTGLQAGQVILSGSLGGMLSVQEGDSFVCEIQHLGRVGVRFGGKRNNS